MAKAFTTIAAALATHHPLAASAGREILLAGGNAVDAAVASMATLCVVLPGSVGFGGYGGSMVAYLAKEKRVVALDFDARAPLAYRDELFADPKKAMRGYLSVTVPAIVAGLAAALREFGTKSWKDVTARAAELAESGYPMESYPHTHLKKWDAAVDPVSRKALFADGKVPELGRPWVQKDLAALIRRLADEGPESFYRGDIARRIVQQVHDHGGILTEEDFTRYRPTLVEPLSIDYRGHQLFTPPPPSGGVTMFQILKTLEQFDITSMEPWSAPYLHLVAEASKLCWTDRQRTAGDPDFVKMPLDELLSAKSAGARAAEIRRADIARGIESKINLNPHTSNVSAIDREGNICSLTATQGMQFGSFVVIEGLGLVMGHGMSRFDFAPGHPNRPAPNKRPHHNMSPTIMLKDGRPFGAVGMPGATRIVTVTAQLIANLIDFDADATTAVTAARVHTDGDEPLTISAPVATAVRDELIAMGHKCDRTPAGGEYTDVGGPANAIVVRDGEVSAASEAGPSASCVVTP